MSTQQSPLAPVFWSGTHAVPASWRRNLFIPAKNPATMEVSERELVPMRATVHLCFLSIVLGACANAVPEAAAPSQEPGSGDTPCGGAVCSAGQTCVNDLCLSLCRQDAECAGGTCVFFPDAAFGYCAAGDLVGIVPESNPDAEVPPERLGPPTSVDAGGANRPPAQGVPPPDAGPPPADVPPDNTPPPEVAPQPPCAYPAAGNQIAIGRTMPHVRWATARDANGAVVDFDLERFYCDAEWARYSVAAFVIGTGWCGACAAYDAQLADIAASFEAAGGLLVMVEIEDENYTPADSQMAFRIVQHSFGGGPALRVGDADTQPMAMATIGSSIIQSYPTAFVVRRSDMQVIANQSDSAGMLDYVQIARDAAADVGPPPGPDPGPGPAVQCVEEGSEPNNGVRRAVPLTVGEHAGGICDDTPDFYLIQTPGPWHVDLLFQNAVGDLDLYLWDPLSRSQLFGNDGSALGSYSEDDNEALDGVGPVALQVVGYEGAHAPYRLRFSE